MGRTRAKRTLREEEKALWRAVARTVRPLPGRVLLLEECKREERKLAELGAPVPPNPASTRKTEISIERAKAPLPKISARPSDLYVGQRAPGLDTTQWRRLTRGKMAVDGKLDLHGFVVQEAFELFLSFMGRARSMNWRCIEIVTGMGSGQTGGAIRRELPHWLQRADLRPAILAVVHPHAANQGAVRVLLRRRR